MKSKTHSAVRKTKTTAPQAKQSIPKPVSGRNGRWPHDPRNPYARPGSSYRTCFNILAAFKAGLPKTRLVTLLAKATGKDLRHAGYDAQIVLSANQSDSGLNNNDGHRNRSCRSGYWVKKENGHVQLMVD